MKPLLNELPRSDDVLFVFYDFETTQYKKISDSATVHFPNVVCLQQFCSLCEMKSDIDVDFERCGKRKHSFFIDPVGDMLMYLCAPRQWCEKAVAIAHNAKVFEAQFILNRAIYLKWKPKLILNGLKIICMKLHHLTFIHSVSFFLCHYVNYPKRLDSPQPNLGNHTFSTPKQSELCGTHPRHQTIWSWWDKRVRMKGILNVVLYTERQSLW